MEGFMKRIRDDIKNNTFSHFYLLYGEDDYMKNLYKNKLKTALLNGSDEMNFSLYTDNVIFYIENSKDSTQKLFELINEFSQVAGYKITIQKSVAFVYPNKYQKENFLCECLFCLF